MAIRESEKNARKKKIDRAKVVYDLYFELQPFSRPSNSSWYNLQLDGGIDVDFENSLYALGQLRWLPTVLTVSTPEKG